MPEDIDLARDGDEQPPEEHDNEAHSRDLVDAEEAAAAAPVQSVNGSGGDVQIETVTDVDVLLGTGYAPNWAGEQ